MFSCYQALLEAFKGEVSKEKSCMTFRRVILKGVVSKVGMGGQRYEANCDTSHEEDIPLRESQHIFFDSCCSGLTILIFNIFNSQDLINWHDDIPKNIIFRYDIRVSLSSIDDDKLIGILVVPDDPIDSICDHLDVVVGFGCREEQIHFTVLMLEDQFGTIFIGKYTENGIVWFMLHHYRFVFDVVVLQSVGVVEVDQEDLGHKILDNLSVSLDRKDPLFALTLDLYQMDFILVV